MERRSCLMKGEQGSWHTEGLGVRDRWAEMDRRTHRPKSDGVSSGPRIEVWLGRLRVLPPDAALIGPAADGETAGVPRPASKTSGKPPEQARDAPPQLSRADPVLPARLSSGGLLVVSVDLVLSMLRRPLDQSLGRGWLHHRTGPKPRLVRLSPGADWPSAPRLG